MQLSIEIKEIKLRITLETYKTIKIKVSYSPLLQKVCYIMLISKSYIKKIHFIGYILAQHARLYLNHIYLSRL